jgi:hypothetical protein
MGNSRNDSREPRLPKDEKKRARETYLREFAKNHGISIAVARAMFEEVNSEE